VIGASERVEDLVRFGLELLGGAVAEALRALEPGLAESASSAAVKGLR
jgi:hypothetical protein